MVYSSLKLIYDPNHFYFLIFNIIKLITPTAVAISRASLSLGAADQLGSLRDARSGDGVMPSFIYNKYIS